MSPLPARKSRRTRRAVGQDTPRGAWTFQWEPRPLTVPHAFAAMTSWRGGGELPWLPAAVLPPAAATARAAAVAHAVLRNVRPIGRHRKGLSGLRRAGPRHETSRTGSPPVRPPLEHPRRRSLPVQF